MGLGRQEARDLLTKTLFDWKTGIPAAEHQALGRFVSFFTYRRGMFRQLGASLTEGFANPNAEYFAKAMTGQTQFARMKNIGRAISAGPEVLYWDDPEQYLDDPSQLDALGKRTAPWWVNNEWLWANRQVSEDRALWESQVAGRKITYEALMLPTLTTMDQLWALHMFLQTGMASMVGLAEKAGMTPNMTTVSADEQAARMIDEFSDFMMPGVDSAVSGAIKGTLGIDENGGGDRGVLVPRAQAIMLRRMGWDDFMAAHPDADGQIRMDRTAYGVATGLILSFPPAADLARNWAVFDNPAMNESITQGLTEATYRWTGLFKPMGHDPFASITYEQEHKEHELKAQQSALTKQVTPRERLKR